MGTALGHVMYDGVFRAEKTPDYIPAPVMVYIKAGAPDLQHFGHSVGLPRGPIPPFAWRHLASILAVRRVGTSER